MLDYIKQLEQQNEELKQRLAWSEYNNERLKQKGHILYVLKGRLQVPDPGFSMDYVITTAYKLRTIVNQLNSMLKTNPILYKSIELRARYNYKTRDFLQDHVPGDGKWYEQPVWNIGAHVNDEVHHRPYYAINGYYFYGIPKSSLKDIHRVNLVDYLKKHIR
jgi:hypothetical protein